MSAGQKIHLPKLVRMPIVSDVNGVVPMELERVAWDIGTPPNTHTITPPTTATLRIYLRAKYGRYIQVGDGTVNVSMQAGAFAHAFDGGWQTGVVAGVTATNSSLVNDSGVVNPDAQGWDYNGVSEGHANAIYVFSTGNDSTGDGSFGNPFLTLHKAITFANNAANNVRLIFFGKGQTIAQGASGTETLTRGGLSASQLFYMGAIDPGTGATAPPIINCDGFTVPLTTEYVAVQGLWWNGLANGSTFFCPSPKNITLHCRFNEVRSFRANDVRNVGWNVTGFAAPHFASIDNVQPSFRCNPVSGERGTMSHEDYGGNTVNGLLAGNPPYSGRIEKLSALGLGRGDTGGNVDAGRTRSDYGHAYTCITALEDDCGSGPVSGVNSEGAFSNGSFTKAGNTLQSSSLTGEEIAGGYVRVENWGTGSGGTPGMFKVSSVNNGTKTLTLDPNDSHNTGALPSGNATSVVGNYGTGPYRSCNMNVDFVSLRTGVTNGFARMATFGDSYGVWFRGLQSAQKTGGLGTGVIPFRKRSSDKLPDAMYEQISFANIDSDSYATFDAGNWLYASNPTVDAATRGAYPNVDYRGFMSDRTSEGTQNWHVFMRAEEVPFIDFTDGVFSSATGVAYAHEFGTGTKSQAAFVTASGVAFSQCPQSSGRVSFPNGKKTLADYMASIAGTFAFEDTTAPAGSVTRLFRTIRNAPPGPLPEALTYAAMMRYALPTHLPQKSSLPAPHNTTGAAFPYDLNIPSPSGTSVSGRSSNSVTIAVDAKDGYPIVVARWNGNTKRFYGHETSLDIDSGVDATAFDVTLTHMTADGLLESPAATTVHVPEFVQGGIAVRTQMYPYRRRLVHAMVFVADSSGTNPRGIIPQALADFGAFLRYGQGNAGNPSANSAYQLVSRGWKSLRAYWQWGQTQSNAQFTVGTADAALGGGSLACAPYNRLRHETLFGTTWTETVDTEWLALRPQLDDFGTYVGQLGVDEATDTASLDRLTRLEVLDQGSQALDVLSAIDFTNDSPARRAFLYAKSRGVPIFTEAQMPKVAFAPGAGAKITQIDGVVAAPSDWGFAAASPTQFLSPRELAGMRKTAGNIFNGGFGTAEQRTVAVCACLLRGEEVHLEFAGLSNSQEDRIRVAEQAGLSRLENGDPRTSRTSRHQRAQRSIA